MIFNYHFEVRGYELDSFGHVNNAVYLNYTEQARWEITKEIGLYEFLKKSGDLLVVTEIKTKYIRELNLFQKARIETYFYKEGFFLIFKHIIRNELNEKVNTATVKCIFINKQRIPQNIPDVINKWLFIKISG